MMKAFCAATAMTLAGSASAAEPAAPVHRYLIERTFPAGALDGVDAAAKASVNANNETLGVVWEKSYANADKTRTWCVYTGPSEAAVRAAAQLNGLPVDSVTGIPADIKPEPRGAMHNIKAGNQRFLVTRRAAPAVSDDTDARFGVALLTSYATADNLGSYWVYEAPSVAAVEQAANASDAPFDSIAVIPETLYPK